VHHLTNFRLPAIRLPELRLPHLRPPSVRIGRPEVDRDDPRRTTEPLQFFFYLLMFVALLSVLTGATGTGVLMLVVGSVLHVVRSSLEETAAQRQAQRERAERKRQVRLRSHRAARKPREETRVSAAPRLKPRRAASAQPGASAARKQRVI
jgi:hypothetical protein